MRGNGKDNYKTVQQTQWTDECQSPMLAYVEQLTEGSYASDKNRAHTRRRAGANLIWGEVRAVLEVLRRAELQNPNQQPPPVVAQKPDR